MRSSHLALVALIVATSTVVVGTRTARADVRTAARARLVDAINKRDARTVESLVVLPLRAEKVRFSSEPCRKFWGVAVLVHTTELPAFVDCIASQKVTALTIGDAKASAIYGPGFPLDIAFNADDKVIALTSTSEPGSKPLRIEPSTFSSHVAKFSREIPPSTETKATLDSHGARSVRAELSLCVDETGATIPVATVADPALRSYEQDVAAAARGWKTAPFKLDGKPVLACATYIVGYPASALDEPAPVTSAPALVDSTRLEPLRTRGSEIIVPDDATKAKIAETDSRRVIGSFKLCLDTKGTPAGITVIKPSGYDAYDQKIMREMMKWAYEPYIVAGSAVPVCTAVTFVYSME